MQKDKMLQYIKNPDNLSVEDTANLQKAMSEYPYTQFLQLLYAKVLHKFDDENFDEELKKIALAVNRVQLFYLINEAKSDKKEKLQNNIFAYSVSSNTSSQGAESELALPKTKTQLLFETFEEKKAKIIFSESIATEEDEKSDEKDVEDEFFSETLAKIYIKQKRYEKAIKIFEKLSLKNPEKSVYFADQIRFLNIIVNNTNKK